VGGGGWSDYATIEYPDPEEVARIIESNERREAFDLLRRVSEPNEWGNFRRDIRIETLRQVIALLKADMPQGV
jgi:hypothetical protein